MNEKRYSHDAMVIVDHLKKDLIYIDGKDELLELAEYVDILQEENLKLKSFIKQKQWTGGIEMTEKRFIIDVEETTQENALFENGKFVCFEDDTDEYLKKINEMSDEIVQLKQFQEQVASVIESKMGDNVCNDYKMEVLKEIWDELELDEVWFE